MCTKKRKEIGKKNLHELVLYEAGYTIGTIFKKNEKKREVKIIRVSKRCRVNLISWMK